MDQSNTSLAKLLHTLESEGAIHDAMQTDRRHKRLNLESETARLLQLLLLSGQRRRVLEIGTSNGCSALWLASALQQIPGAHPLITIERETDKAEQARHNIERGGLGAWVDIRVGDATAMVATLSGPFDAVFFDADRISAPAQLARLLPHLEEDVLLLADNALSHPQEIADYLAAVEQLPAFVSTVVPVGKGLHVAHRLGKRSSAA